MPGPLLHVGASVMCSHAGNASPTSPSARVNVGGQPIVMMTAPYSVAGCTWQISGVPTPCVTASWVTGATRVTSDGQPVLLMDSQAVCAPNATPLLITSAQTRVTGT